MNSEKASTDPTASEWKPVVDPESGDTYYWNIRTNATTWKDPFDPNAESEDEESTSDASAADQDEAASIKAATSSKSVQQQPSKVVQQPLQTHADVYYPPHTYLHSQPATPASNEAAATLDALFQHIDQHQTTAADPAESSNLAFDREAGTVASSSVPAHLQHYQNMSKQKRAMTDHERWTAQAQAPLFQPEYEDYQLQAQFNVKTGKFDGKSEANLNPLRRPDHFTPHQRASQVMSEYFDYNQWLEQRNADIRQERQEGVKKQRLSKQEVNAFKKKREERKKAKNRWLYED